MQYFGRESFAESNSTLKKFQLEREFLVYLNQNRILQDLEEAAFRYKKVVVNALKKGNFLPPFRFPLELDLMKIQEISEKLYLLCVKEPDAGIDLAKGIIYYAVKLVVPILNSDKSDLQVVLHVKNLPITCEITDLLHYPTFALESIQGVLISKSSVAKYTRSSVYSCRLISCPGYKWRRYPENYGHFCGKCLSYMDEDVSSSDMGEEVICQFVSLKAYQKNGRFQTLTVRIKDELCASINLQVGEEYKLIGRLNGIFFDVMNVQAKTLRDELFTSLFHLQSFTLPESIAELYFTVSEETNNPWSFVFALSSQIGSHLVPISAFLHLKTGMLLSLATQNTSGNPVPLVAIGDDSLNAQILFHIAGQYAERYVRYSIAHSYLGGVTKSGLQSDVILQEAGQLILAAKGVCNLGDWSKFKKEQANCICQAIESSQIVFNKGECGKQNFVDFVPLKCAVWTHWCHITKKQNHQLQLKTLINVFGIPFLAEEKNDLEIKKICWKNLKMAMCNSENESNTLSVPAEDLKEFIGIVNARELILTDAASQLIRNYFVVSRRERPHCLPLGAINTITSLAQAHARLALRNEVLFEDVIAIIFLYEEAISTLFGESIKPYPKLTWDQNEPIYVFMGKQIQKFGIWLEEYISM